MANSSLPRQALVICGLLATCGKPVGVRVLDADDFPQKVGPPFDLDALAGGMSGREVSSVLGRTNGSGHRIDYSLRNASLGVVGRLAFDGERLADIIFTFENCEAVRAILLSRWGAPSEESFQMTKQLLWQSSQSHWFASMNAGLATGQCSVDFTSSDFFGPTVAAFEQVSQLKPGMSRAAAMQLSREVATSGIATEFHAVSDGFQGVAYDRATLQGVAYDQATDRVEQVYLILPPRAIAALRRAWGNGTIVSGGEPRTVWFDAGTGDRATLDETRDIFDGGTGDRATFAQTRVIFDKAVRWEDWLGDGTSIKALGSPIVGRLITDLKKERGADLSVVAPDKLDISHHPTVELSARPPQWAPDSRTRVDLRNDGVTVTHLTFTLDYDAPATRAAMVHAFETKWGASRPGPGELVFHADHMTFRVFELDSGFQVSMENDH